MINSKIEKWQHIIEQTLIKKQETEIAVNTESNMISMLLITKKDEVCIAIALHIDDTSILDRSLFRGSCPIFS